MADATIQFHTVAGATTCQFAGLSYSVLMSGQAKTFAVRVVITNADVSQATTTSGQLDDSAPVVGRRDTLITSKSRGVSTTPVTSASAYHIPASSHPRGGTGRRRRRSGLRVPRALTTDQDGDGVADFLVTNTIDTTMQPGEGALGWTVSVPEGYYVVTALVSEPSLHVTVIDAPRFYVGIGASTACINSATFQPASSTADRQLPTQATVNAPTPPAGKQPLPIAAIVGISIAGVVLIIILVLVCVWNKRERRKPIHPKLPEPVEQMESSFFARDAGTLAGRTTRASLAQQPTSPVPPLPSHRPAYVPYSQR